MSASLASEVERILWYHTLDLGDGVVTPGWFDLRPIADALPWPDVAGKRCLDVGTYDGFFAFELERRHAAEVVAVDINDHTKWDWPYDLRGTGAANLARLAGPERGAGFRVAAQALGSSVRMESMSVYDLSPELVGTFDVVTCGSLLLHLRDPMRALEAIRTVCSGQFMSCETIEPTLSAMLPRLPVARLGGIGELCQWWTPNRAGHHRMLESAGFTVDVAPPPYAIPMGRSHSTPNVSLRRRATLAARRRWLGNDGVPHSAALTHPRI